MNNIKHQEVLTLISELQQLGTFSRMVSYGPVSTLALGMSRFFNSDVNDYFQNYLEELDKAILFFNDTDYKVNIDRYTLGELYNVTRNNASVDDAEDFFKIFFESLNLITLEIIKAGIDEAYDNGAALKGVSSLRSLSKINYTSESFDQITNIINKYYITIANKPLSLLNLFSYLKRYRLDTTFISNTVKALEKEVIAYIKLKYSVGEGTVHTIINQNDQ